MSDTPPTAILTKGQREYIRGEREPTQERTMRTRIRRRIQRGILDFGLVGDHLEDDDRDKVVDEMDYGEAIEPLITMVSFAYQICRVVGLDAEAIFQEGIARGEAARSDRPRSVRLQLDVEQSTDTLLERYEAGDPTLTWGELDRLQEAEGIETEHPGHSGSGVMGVSDEIAEEIEDARDDTEE